MRILKHLQENYLLYAIVVLGAFLRFYKADFQSLWLDEVLSMNDSDPSISLKEINEKVLFWEYLPQLFFYLLHFVFKIFGYTPLVGRLFAAVIGVGGIFAMYLLGKEAYNRNAGLIAALFLSVNSFHIAYSQEIRPYGLLFLFTVLSFYGLLRFVKVPSFQNAIGYGLFTGLIIHGHFFGIITVFGQSLVLLYLLIQTPAESRNRFLLFCSTAGITALLVILPTYKAIQRIFDVRVFWLPPPTGEVYSDMFRDFLGRSEMVIFGAHLIILFFVLTLFKKTTTGIKTDDIKSDPLLLSSGIIFTTLLVSLLIPLIKSHLDISMIVHRYFIGILGILVLALAIGTQLIDNRLVKSMAIIYFVAFSVTDLFVVQRYYSATNKTQFRELTDQIKKLNPKKSTVVAHWGWIFPYFFKDDAPRKVIISDFDAYIESMRSKSTPVAPFWYADANSRAYQVSGENQKYLDQNFIRIHKLEYFDCWAFYYLPKKKRNDHPPEPATTH